MSINTVVNLWLEKIESSKKHKWDVFGEVGERAWKFYGEPTHSFMYEEFEHQIGSKLAKPTWQATIAKTAEYVAIYLPYLHHKVPTRVVTPKRPPIPPEIYGLPPGAEVPPTLVDQQDKIRAMLLEWYLNYTPGEYDLRGESRRSIVEALVKGRGLWWHEFVEGYSGRMIGSFFVSVDDLFMDPDADCPKNATWIARRRRAPKWQLLQMYPGVEAERVKGDYQSRDGKSMEEWDDDADRKRQNGEHCDVVEYYELYSRAGIGEWFEGTTNDLREMASMLTDRKNVYLVLVPGLPYPANLPPSVVGSLDPTAELQERLKWPIPWFTDVCNPWPFTELDFFPGKGTCWPRSPLTPALPIQVFLNYMFSWLMGRLRSTCRDLIVHGDHLDPDLQNRLVDGRDQEVVKVKGGLDDVSKEIFVLQFPSVNTDAWTMWQLAVKQFEDATGLTEIMRGGPPSKQLRSASEAQMRQQQMSVRPDDMAECVEDAMSRLARKEAFAVRLFVDATAVGPLFGEVAQPSMMGMQPQMGILSQLWQALVMCADDPYRAAAEMSYSVAAGSGRKKNRLQQLDAMQQLGQVALPLMMQYWQITGDPGKINAWLRDMASALETNAEDYMFAPLQPPQPAPVPGQQALTAPAA